MTAPLWAEEPLNHCSESTKNELESAIKSIGIAKNKEKDLQTVTNFVFHHLLEESFHELKFEMKYSFESQLNYRTYEEDPNFLPTNFNNSAWDSTADLAILIVLPNQKKFPILIGELKANIRGTESDYVQLFNYMLTVQRPYRVNENGSHLIGFLMDFDEAFIFRLPVGFWTQYNIVPSIVLLTQFLFFFLPIMNIYKIHIFLRF